MVARETGDEEAGVEVAGVEVAETEAEDMAARDAGPRRMETEGFPSVSRICQFDLCGFSNISYDLNRYHPPPAMGRIVGCTVNQYYYLS